jgi:hypothetical protein
MNEVTTRRFPWEPAPIAETLALLQRDFAIAVQLTAVKVHSNRPAMEMTINTKRGQVIPAGLCRFTDGTTFEMQDIGMPQPGCELCTVAELVGRLAEMAKNLGLELMT